ncbi:MAG: riboflavin synthase [Chitinophagaceae bacterium]
MFTGIIEKTGHIKSIISSGTNKSFWVQSLLSDELKVDQSLSHNGVCLTVEEIIGNTHRVTAIEETLLKSNLGNWKEGSIINLERCLPLNGRLDGHIVQGHVDCTAQCKQIEQKEGSWEFLFTYPSAFAALLIEKGSVSLNGISLTVFNVSSNHFKVAIIPYTYEHTNMKAIAIEETVNIEFDMIGKYVNRIQNLK